MQMFDRYLIRLFAKVVLVCFISITGLYVVIDACNNLDEFLAYGKQQGGTVSVLLQYYSARIPWFFDQISGLLALIAAMFAVTWLQRTNEMTALMAAGIRTSRIIRPLIAAAVAVSLLAALNREVVLPSVRAQLIHNAQDWLGETARSVEPVLDNQTGILINGRHTFAQGQRIERPGFRLQRRIGEFGRKLEAAEAVYRPASADRPAGYLLRQVSAPDVSQIRSGQIDGRTILFSPFDTAWLKPDECFVVSAITFDQLVGGSQWRQLSSTGDLIVGLRNPSLTYGPDARVTVHSRFVQPILDISLFLLGLPLVLTRENRNIFVAAGWCLLVVLAFIFVVMVCHAMGSSGYLFSPAFAAWCPVFLFAPLATAVSSPLWE